MSDHVRLLNNLQFSMARHAELTPFEEAVTLIAELPWQELSDISWSAVVLDVEAFYTSLLTTSMKCTQTNIDKTGVILIRTADVFKKDHFAQAEEIRRRVVLAHIAAMKKALL